MIINTNPKVELGQNLALFTDMLNHIDQKVYLVWEASTICAFSEEVIHYYFDGLKYITSDLAFLTAYRRKCFSESKIISNLHILNSLSAAVCIRK